MRDLRRTYPHRNEALLHYIADGQAAFLETLMSVERFDSKSIVENDDPRVHLCIYFVQPHGPAYGLSCFEIALLRELSLMSNLIICLPKADTMLPHEQSLFRQKVTRQKDALVHSVRL